MARCSKAEKIKRIAVVVRFIMQETTSAEIIHYVSEKWGLGERQAENYIADARRQIKKDIDSQRKDTITTRMAKRAGLYREAFKAQQYALCLEIEKDIAKLEGLYTEKIDLTSKNTNLNGDIPDKTTEELVAEANFLRGITNEKPKKQKKLKR